MTEAQAQMLVAKLFGAFSRDASFLGEASNAVYVEKIAVLDRFEAARDAIDDLIESELRLPPIAMILENYRRFWDRYSPPALEEGSFSDADRDANVRRMRAMSSHLAARGADGHAAELAECPHPDCVELRSLSVPSAGQD